MGDRTAKIDDILRRLARGHCSPARVADTGCDLCEPRLAALRELRALLTESVDRALVERWLASEQRETSADPHLTTRAEVILGYVLRGQQPPDSGENPKSLR